MKSDQQIEMNILILIDGSDSADRAVDYVINYADKLKIPPRIFILNVQWKLALGNVRLFFNKEIVKQYHSEQGILALAKARAKLDMAKLPYSYHISVGKQIDAVVRYAEEHKIEQIVMSAQGQESLSNFLSGSVAS